jgi:competence protein ComEA
MRNNRSAAAEQRLQSALRERVGPLGGLAAAIAGGGPGSSGAVRAGAASAGADEGGAVGEGGAVNGGSRPDHGPGVPAGGGSAADPLPADDGRVAALRAAAAARLPAPVRDGVLDPRPHGAWTVVAMVVVAAVAAAAVLLQSRPKPTPVVRPTLQVTMSAIAGGASPSPGAGSVVVDVAGAVRRPGLLTLPAGSRVADAVRMAGGLRPGTKQAGINLARRLVDGEQLVVGPPRPGTVPPADPTAPVGPGAPTAPVNLNTATLDELQALPEVGPVTAQRIVDWRTAHGGFASVDQLQEVEGIGEHRFASLRGLVTV